MHNAQYNLQLTCRDNRHTKHEIEQWIASASDR
jgi:hypothetical protein